MSTRTRPTLLRECFALGSRTTRAISGVLAVPLTGLGLTSLTLVAVPSASAATETVTVCSHNGTDYYNILGDNASSVREKLDAPANFGPDGTYGDYDFDYVDVGSSLTSAGLIAADCDIFYSGYESDGDYTVDELDQLEAWVTADVTRQVMAGCDGSSNDPVCDRLGFSITTDVDSYGFLIDRPSNPLNCDGLLSNTDQLNMAGGVGGYFSGRLVAPSNVAAVHETDGAADQTKPIVIYTGNYFFTSDINMIQNGGTEETVTDGTGVTTNNDKLMMNAFSALADASVGKKPCVSAAPPDTTAPTTVDDVPTTQQTSPVTVTLTAVDEADGSGVASTRYTIGTIADPPADPRVSGAAYDPSSKPALADGQVIRYSSTDESGNVETPKTSSAAQVVATVSKPAISGTAQVGRTLTATAASSTPGAQLGYRWFRDGAAIAGATAASYAVVGADAGKVITVVADASATGYRSTASDPSDPVTVTRTTLTPVPGNYTAQATGGVRVGTVRVARTSLDDDGSITLGYQWQRANNTGAWVDLPGASAERRRYELPPAVMKLNVRVKVTATRGASRVVKASAPLVILPGNHDASDPRITGTLEVGERITAVYDDEVEPEGLGVTYNWTIGGNEIRASGRSITLPARSAGKRVICDIRLTAPGYHNQEFRTPARSIRR